MYRRTEQYWLRKYLFGLRGAWDLRITICVLADFRASWCCTHYSMVVLSQCTTLLMETPLVSNVSANGLLESRWKLG